MTEQRLYEVEGYKLLCETLIDYEGLWNAGCATKSQIGYLMGAIRNHRFKNDDKIKNVIEIGVCSGLSSLYMLKAGAVSNNFRLYGIEKQRGDFFGKDAFANATKEELGKWKLFLGHTSYDIEEILDGDVLDMVFIDGLHAHPGPLIDFLLLFPFMRKDALVIFHDVETYLEPSELGACYFYTGWNGGKRLNYRVVGEDGELGGTEYMGILNIEREEKDIYADLLQIAKQPITGCTYPFSGKDDPLAVEYDDIDIRLRLFMHKYYPTEFANEMIGILLKNYTEYKSKWIYYKHVNRLMNTKRFETISNANRKELSLLEKSIFGKCRIAIWGAGARGKKLVSDILASDSKKEIAIWVDSRSQNGIVQMPVNLKKADFDYLIIAVESKQIYSEIFKQCIELGIESEKVKWLFS